jgi:hypothetical protein
MRDNVEEKSGGLLKRFVRTGNLIEPLSKGKCRMEEMPLRKTLDKMKPPGGVRLRIYYPYDTPPKVMTTTGLSQECESPRAQGEYEFREEMSGKTEWGPGWYIASAV